MNIAKVGEVVYVVQTIYAHKGASKLLLAILLATLTLFFIIVFIVGTNEFIEAITNFISYNLHLKVQSP